MDEMHKALFDEVEEWREAYEDLCVENKIMYDALRILTSSSYGFKAQSVAREALKRVKDGETEGGF
jgi:hypothetical protein